MAVSSADFSARIFDAATGRGLLTLSRHAALLSDVAYSPDGSRIATSSWDSTVIVSDARSGQTRLTLLAGPVVGIANGMAFSPDGAWLAASGGTALTVWDASTGRNLWTFSDSTQYIYAVAYSPDGTRLAAVTDPVSSGGAGGVDILEAATGRKLAALSGHTEAVDDVVFNRDGTRLATSSYDGTAKIWDAATGHDLLTVTGHTETILRLAYSPDGTRLATAGADGTARLRDATTGQPLLTLYGDNTEMDDVAFSPDGGRLYGVTDTALHVYALKLDDLIALAKSRVTRILTTAECQQYLHVASCPASP